MNQIKFVVTLAGYNSQSTGYHRRRIKTPITLYIKAVSYGKQSLLSKWWMTANKEDAQQFSKVMAEDIQQFLTKQRCVDVKTSPVEVLQEVTQ